MPERRKGFGSGPAAGRKAKPTIYNGVRYGSRMEAAYAQELDRLVNDGTLLFWVPQPLFRLGCPENTYRPDFLVVYRQDLPGRGLAEAHEVKGVETTAFRRNLKLWERYGPCPLVVWNGRKVTHRIERIEETQ